MTVAPGTLINLQYKLETYHNLINLGITGDDRHVATGGYHIGAATLRNNGMSGDYSLEFAADRVTHDYACAVDIGGRPDQLMNVGNRIVHALKNHDPRVYGRVRGVNAPFDGVSIDRRLDDESPTTSADDNVQSSDDRGHIHIEIYRSLVTNQTVINDLYNVLIGAGTSGAPAPAPKPTGKIYQGAPVPAMIAQGTGQYFGLITGPNNSHGGYYASERQFIQMIQRRLMVCGFVPGHTSSSDPWADGIFEQPTADAVTRFQRAHMPGTQYFGQVWFDDWRVLFNL